MANEASIVGLMLALIAGGVIITFNLVPALGLGFDNINGAISAFWTILARGVGVALIVLPTWVIYQVIKEGI